METKPKFLGFYHGVNNFEFIGAAWSLFQFDSESNAYEEIDYGDSIIEEPKKAIANTACFIAATLFLKHFRKNYPVSKLTLSGCNQIVCYQLSGLYKIGQGSYVSYAEETLSLMGEMREEGYEIESVFDVKNEAKELAHLTKI